MSPRPPSATCQPRTIVTCPASMMSLVLISCIVVKREGIGIERSGLLYLFVLTSLYLFLISKLTFISEMTAHLIDLWINGYP